MREVMLESRIRRLKWGFIVLAVVTTVVLAWFFFFSSTPCESWNCFNAHLQSCSAASFIGGDQMIFEYTIRGESDNRCEVDVVLMQGELNNRESGKLEGHMMECSLPLGVVMLPEADLSSCHGILKENLQDLIIQRLHNYIAQNLGRINLEILRAPIPLEDSASNSTS